MDKQNYETKREEILNLAQTLLEEGKTQDATAKMAEAEELDKAYDAQIKARANLDALKAQKLDTVFFAKAPAAKFNEPEQKVDYEVAFAKSLLGRDLSAAEADVYARFNPENAVTTKGAHGSVIPETLMSEIITEMGKVHPVLNEVRIMHVKGNLTLPTGTLTAGADWYEDGTATTDGSVSTAEINLYGYDLKANIDLSYNLKEMSIPAFLNFIKTELVNAMADKLANGIINGLGIPSGSDMHKAQPTGVITALNAETSTPRVLTYSASSTSAQKEAVIRQMLGKLKTGYKAGAAFYAKSDFVWNVLAGIQDSDGRSYFVPDCTAGGVGRIFGVPVKEEDAIPDDILLLGNFDRGYIVNFNKDVTLLTQDDHKNVKTSYTAYGIVDGKPRLNEAFVLLKKS